MGDFAELRTRIQDLANRPDWAAILALAPQMRLDTEYWTMMWAPLLAVAGRKVGDPGARGYLDEAIEGGFSQPELLEGELERHFGGDPDWPALAAAIAANLPPAAVELRDWPELTPALPVQLAEIAPDRRDALRERLPEAQASAWATATELLHWTSTRWAHSGSSHAADADALAVLDRVAAGERFACKEYTIVLSQVLNARGIPARSVSVLVPNHHAGRGRAHDVSEAWIDDLGAWVLLDGQNGMYWADADGTPLGTAELRRRENAGEPRPGVVSLAGKSSAESAALWWSHFRSAAPTGVMLAAPPYPPVSEELGVLAVGQLRRDPAGSYPDLLELGIGITETGGGPGIRPQSRHPFARGFEVRLDGRRWELAPGEAWPLPADAGAGEHTATISTITDFGAHGPHELRFAQR